MSLEEFRKQLVSAQPFLSAWGMYVKDQALRLAVENGVSPQIVGCRVKDIDSAIGKLTRKSYDDPMRDMTDLVGVRLVCLLTPDIHQLSELIQQHPDWNASIARNTAKEAEEQPEQFGYQSIHLEVRPTQNIYVNDVLVPAEACCELQIRTLMQHAFAEVVHDNIYKSPWGAPSKARRFVSNSAALIEAADHLFCETMTILDRENKDRGELLGRLTHLYDSTILKSAGKDQKFNMIVLNSFESHIDDSIIDDISTMLTQRMYIIDNIRDRVSIDPFWSQPVSILAYYIAMHHPSEARQKWPFAESEPALAQIFSDLGKKYYQ